MQISVNSKRAKVGPLLRHRLEHRLESALERLSGWVQTATLYFDDVNGPRGGMCKRCRVIVAARGIELVVVTETGENMFTSASRAIRRAKAAIQRRVKQRRGRKTKAIRTIPRDADTPPDGNGTKSAYDAGVMGCTISDRNRTRLRRVVEEARHRGIAPPELFRFLEEKLATMECLPAGTMPSDVVTMNSKFHLREVATNDLKTCVLCYPDAVGPSNGDLSVLAPLGAAVLGCRVGDEIKVEGHGDVRRFQLVEVVY